MNISELQAIGFHLPPTVVPASLEANNKKRFVSCRRTMDRKIRTRCNECGNSSRQDHNIIICNIGLCRDDARKQAAEGEFLWHLPFGNVLILVNLCYMTFISSVVVQIT